MDRTSARIHFVSRSMSSRHVEIPGTSRRPLEFSRSLRNGGACCVGGESAPWLLADVAFLVASPCPVLPPSNPEQLIYIASRQHVWTEEG